MTTTELSLPLPIDTLRSLLREHGAVSASVFGSYARGEQNSNSDLDLLVEFKSGVGYGSIFTLQERLEKLAGVKIDLATKLNKHFVPYIEPDLVSLDL